MIKAFTLSETLITLSIISVMASVLMPTMNNARPDKDKVTYKKALYNVQSAVSNAMESSLAASNSAAYWQDATVGESDFCNAVAESLNTSGAVDCSGPAGTSSYDNPNFITTDGIRYWGLEGNFRPGGEKITNKVIHVDHKLSGGEKRVRKTSRTLAGDSVNDDTEKEGMKIYVKYDGKVTTPCSDGEGCDSTFHYENELIENSMDVTKGKKSK